MKAKRKYLEHTADILFQAEASTLAELFEQCALAVEESQVNLARVEAKRKVLIRGKNKNLESLLFDFLDNLLFYKDANQLIFSKFKIKINEQKGRYKLICQAYGEKLDFSKHEPKIDVKAITMHLFELKKVKQGWRAQVLIDI